MITEQEIFDILRNMPEPKLVFMRLYYDDQGKPICYSMENQPGNYIDVDAETYARSPMNLRVIDGRIKYINTARAPKLVPGAAGTCCHPNSVDIIVTEQEPHTKWSKKIYETD